MSHRKIVFLPNGKLALCQWWEKAQVLNTELWKEVVALPGNIISAGEASFSPDSNVLATVGGRNTLKIWDLHSGRKIWEDYKEDQNWADDVLFSPDGRWLFVGGSHRVLDRAITMLEPNTFRQVRIIEGSIGRNSAVFSPNGKCIITAVGSWAKLWNIETGQLVAMYQPYDGTVETAMFFQGTEKLLTVSRDRTARIWDTQGHELAVLKHPLELRNAVILSGGTNLITVMIETLANPDERNGPFCTYALQMWQRRRPEYWWGVAWLPEFWLTMLFAGALVWSVRRDRRILAK